MGEIELERYVLTKEALAAYEQNLRQEEKAAGTIEKYLREARAFACWVGERPVSRETVAAWKAHRKSEGAAPATINGGLAALNGLFRFLGWEGCRARFIKIQRRVFQDPSRELTKTEYARLTAAARDQGRERLALLLETICATGIRVSEVAYITVEALRVGKAEVALKGKIRTILWPAKLGRKLLKYAQKQKIASGAIFRTRSGKPLSRGQIWGMLKRLSKVAGVDSSKVFPHNLRHLFATTFYQASKDIVKLADVLGHSSMETTRIYLLTSGQEHQRQLDQLGLVK